MYAKTILFQARLLVRNREDAEDVAQKVAIAMLRDIRKLRSPYAFRSWLQRLIVNMSNKHNAQMLRETGHMESLSFAESVVDESPETQPEDVAVSRDMRRFVGGYLERLPAAQAVALALYYYEQLSYKEVAEVMGVSIGSVSSTISKAKQNLKKMLKENGEQDVMGIVFIPPFIRKNIKQAVTDEIEHTVPAGAVTRFMSVCRAHISGIVAGVGTSTAVTGTWGTLVAATTALLLLGGAGLGTYLLWDQEPPGREETPSVERVMVAPDSRVIYALDGEQLYDNPVDPLAVQFLLLGNEQMEYWILTNSNGIELTRGTGGAIKESASSQTTSREIVGSNFIDLRAMNLAEGEYTLNWYLSDEQGGRTRAYWSFTIAPTP
jgi:RNA polymerase sigma-70 factor (ECF subfamily)